MKIQFESKQQETFNETVNINNIIGKKTKVTFSLPSPHPLSGPSASLPSAVSPLK